MRRRDFIGLIGGAATAWPLAAQAQQPQRLGILGSSSSTYHTAFRQALRDLGYVEGQNLVIEDRAGRLPDAAADLVRRKVEVIFAQGGSEATRVARQVTTDIPIVTISSNPVALGFVASLARPGGNITGLSLQSPEASGKRLELLKQIAPRIASVALLGNPDDPGTALQWKETEAAAAALALSVRLLEIRDDNCHRRRSDRITINLLHAALQRRIAAFAFSITSLGV